ncbi:beta-lactamase family protein [Pseudocitrobacter faecalis]|nr:beta-lactamase family protein [Pseudocitrobacter faecalis]
MISHNQPPQLFSYGFTDSDRRVPVTGDTLFALGSVTKGVTAEIAALQVQKNKLTWHSTLHELLPSAKELSPDAQKITVEQLASHTAGLPRQAFDLPMLGKLVRYVFTGEQFYDDLDRGEYQDYLSTFRAPDNVQVNYSNLGYAILDSALEQSASRTIPEMAQQDIFTPLKMLHTGYVPETLPVIFCVRVVRRATSQSLLPVVKWYRSGASAMIWSAPRRYGQQETICCVICRRISPAPVTPNWITHLPMP